MGIKQAGEVELNGYAKLISNKFKAHCKEIIDIKHMLRYAKTRKVAILNNVQREMSFKGEYEDYLEF